MRMHSDVKFFIIGVTPHEFNVISRVFAEKYTTGMDRVVPTDRVTDLYRSGMRTTLTVDVRTFTKGKEFFPGDVHCYSNEHHQMFRYASNRTVTYYGYYNYQPHDICVPLKLNFSIFRPTQPLATGTFVSSPNMALTASRLAEYEARFPQPIVIKHPTIGSGNILANVSNVHYVHTDLDKNNRIIPEGFYYNKSMSYDEMCSSIIDSAGLRYDDCTNNGIDRYHLTTDDVIIQACLK